MKRLLSILGWIPHVVIVLVFVAAFIVTHPMYVHAQSIWTGQLDKYGGAITNPPNYCAVSATTDWSYQEINSRWLLCDPLRNPLFMFGIFAADVTDVVRVNSTLLINKYGNQDTKWGPAQVRRFRLLGINATLSSSSSWVRPWQTNNSDPAWVSTIDSDGNAKVANSQPTKMSAINTAFMDSYPARNVFNYCGQPNKQLYKGINITSDFWGYYPGGMEDPWDSCYQTWIHLWFTTNSSSTDCGNSLFCIGFQSHESDFIYGMEAGDPADFATLALAGGVNNNPHLAAVVLVNSPYQTATQDPVGNAQTYLTDRTLAAKSQLSTFLQGRYANIGALNTAWGSSYASFASAGVNKVETCGTGNGTLTSFTCTLSFAIDKCSVWVSVETSPGVGLTPKAGDFCRSGAGGPPTANTLIGAITGTNTINYSTKAVTVTFSFVPCNGCAIKVDYFSGGWGNCTPNSTCGLMDENGAGAGLPTGGVTAYMSLLNTTSGFKADMSAFLTAFTKQFFKIPHDEEKAKWPGKLYLGPNVVGSWCTPPRREILAEMANWLDAIFTNVGACNAADDQARFDFIYTYWGNKPIGGHWTGITANPESYYGGVNDASRQTQASTQAARATLYSTLYTELTTRATTSGGHKLFAGGAGWWAWYDSGSELQNFGLGTPHDNLYDGVQATTTGGSYTDSVLGLLTGPAEASNFGNFITTFKTKNLNVYNDILPAAGGTVAATPTASPIAGTYTAAQISSGVTLSTTSAGAIICWALTGTPATNGASGCTSGTLYSGAITVSATETIVAVAGGTGYTDSSVGSFGYTIVPTPPPPPPPPLGIGIPPLIILSADKCKLMTPSDELCKGYDDLNNLLGSCIVCGL